MSASQRSKGARGEVEVVAMLKATGWPNASRNWMSGAAGFGDFLHGPEGVILEAKRVEALRFWDSWKQVAEDAEIAGPEFMPVLATRRNASKWLAVCELEDLLDLLKFRETAL